MVRKQKFFSEMVALFGKRTTSIKILDGSPSWVSISLRTCEEGNGSKRNGPDYIKLRFLRSDSVDEMISQLQEVKEILKERESNG